MHRLSGVAILVVVFCGCAFDQERVASARIRYESPISEQARRNHAICLERVDTYTDALFSSTLSPQDENADTLRMRHAVKVAMASQLTAAGFRLEGCNRTPGEQLHVRVAIVHRWNLTQSWVEIRMWVSDCRIPQKDEDYVLILEVVAEPRSDQGPDIERSASDATRRLVTKLKEKLN